MPKLITRPESFQFSRIKEIATLKVTSKAINTDYFGSNLEPNNAPANHRLYILLATTSVVNLLVDDGTNSDISMSLNNGNALTAGVLYAFDVIIPAGYSYNVQHATGTQNVSCWVVESGVLS